MEGSSLLNESPVFFNIILVGDSAVGKTTIIHQYLQEEFLSEPETTIGYEYKFKTFFNIYPYKLRIKIWDVPGKILYGL
jgi:small GTP-binding protein